MIWLWPLTWPLLGLLAFASLTDWVALPWPHAVFRATSCTLCAVCLLLGREPIKWSATLLPLTGAASWGLLQIACGATVAPQETWLSALHWLAYAALFFTALQTPLRAHLRLLAWFGGAYAVFASAQMLLATGDERLFGGFLNQNHYAAFLELLFPIALWRALRDRRKAVYAVCALAMLTSVAASGSRMGMALLVLELLYVGVKTTRRPAALLTGTLTVAALLAAISWPRLELLATPEPYQSRAATARASLRMIQDRPLIGYGLGAWPTLYPAYAELDTGFRLLHADNDWLEWTAEGGFPFLALMAALAGFAALAAWRQPWFAGCLAVLLHGLVEFPLQKQAIWAGFVLLLAAAQQTSKPSARRKEAS